MTALTAVLALAVLAVIVLLAAFKLEKTCQTTLVRSESLVRPETVTSETCEWKIKGRWSD